MEERTLQARIASWRKEQAEVQLQVQRALAEGTIGKDMAKRLAGLKAEGEALLEEALPYARERLIGSRDLHGTVTVLAPDIAKIGEASLPEEVRNLAERELVQDKELPEPLLPEGLEPDLDDEGWHIGTARLKGMPYTSVGGDQTIFLFTDEGACHLLEHNLSWQMAPEPLSEEAFVTRAALESPASCLFVDVDGRLCRLSYARLESPQQLMQEPLYV